jgi:NADH dehydrogenase (ubiquinone) Fe-S protein 6
MLDKVPIVEVDKEFAICDGGGGALGHPIEYISLAVPGSVVACKYCGLRYTCKKKDHH